MRNIHHIYCFLHSLQVTTFLYRVRTSDDAKLLKSVIMRETSAEDAYVEFQKQAPILSDDEEEAPDADGSERQPNAATPAAAVAAPPPPPPPSQKPAAAADAAAPAGTSDEQLIFKMFVSSLHVLAG